MASRQRLETDAKNANVSAFVDNFFLLNAFTGFPLQLVVSESWLEVDSADR